MNDYEKMTQGIFASMLTAIRREKEAGRHPRVKVESYSPGTGLRSILISSEQISERLEVRPSEFEAFKRVLAENNIPLEG